MSELVKMYMIYVGGGFIFVLVAFLLTMFLFTETKKGGKK